MTTISPKLKCLNLGCGQRFHPDWTNVDFVSSGPQVQAHDLNRGVPFPDETFDVVYHSHVLEHFTRERGLYLIQECWRVLRRSGLLRVAVPDLEQIARKYLEALEKAFEGRPAWDRRYEWMMLELCDQIVREKPGGAMLEFLKTASPEDEAFIMERLGGEVRRMINAIRDPAGGESVCPAAQAGLRALFRRFSEKARHALLRVLLGREGKRALKLTEFRASGEVHRWMYDRYSLGKVLREAGFRDPVTRGPAESQIPGWPAFCLDTEPDGGVYKPDSLYMEAVKL